MHRRIPGEIVGQLISSVELETQLALQVPLSDPTAEVAQLIHEQMREKLAEVSEDLSKAPKLESYAARTMVRKALLPLVESISIDLIHRAKSGYVGMATAGVQYMVNIENDWMPPNFSDFEFDELPFINHQDWALQAALTVRVQPHNIQLQALKALVARSELEDFEHSEYRIKDLPFSPSYARKHKAVKSEVDATIEKFPLDLQCAIDDFYLGMRVGSIHPYALPIALSVATSVEDSRLVARVYKFFGRDLRIPVHLKYQGSRKAIKRAKASRLLYESAGHGFAVLSAWLRALETLEIDRICSICYRHVSAVSRCAEHATKSFETRDARAGKKIRPIYMRILRRYMKDPDVRKTLMSAPPSWNEDDEEAIEHAAQMAGLRSVSKTAAIALAHRLRGLRSVMSPQMQDEAQALFQSMLNAALEFENQYTENRFRARSPAAPSVEDLEEMLSIEGFFRAWYGTGTYPKFFGLKKLGHDRNHPVAVGGAINVSRIPMSLLMQRAWQEAHAEYRKATSPSAEDAYRYLNTGMSKPATAKKLNIALSTLYKVLQRGDQARKRQFLGRT